MRIFTVLKNNKIAKALRTHTRLILKISLIALPFIFFLFGFFGSKIEKNNYPTIVNAQAPPGYPNPCGQRRCAYSLGATEQYYCRDACGTQPNHCVTVGSCDSTACIQDSDCSRNVACPGPDGTKVCAKASCDFGQCVYQCYNPPPGPGLPGVPNSCESNSCSGAAGFRMAGCTPPGWVGIPERVCGVTATNGNIRTVVGLSYSLDTLNYYVHQGALGTSNPTLCRFNSSLKPLRAESNPDLWDGKGCGTFYDEDGNFTLGVATPLCIGCAVTPNNTWESGNVKRGRYRIKVVLKNLNATGTEGVCSYIVKCQDNGGANQAATIERVDRNNDFTGVGECEQPNGSLGVKGAYIDPSSVSVSNTICNLNGTGNGPFDGGGWGSVRFGYNVVDQGIGSNLRVDVGGWYFEPEYQWDKLQGIGGQEQRLCGNSDICWSGAGANCGTTPNTTNGCTLNTPNGSNFSYSLNTETYAFKTNPANPYWIGIDTDNRTGSCQKSGEYAITTTGAVPAGNFDIARCNDPPRADALKGWACEIGNPSYQIPVQICKDAPCDAGGIPIAVVVANRDRTTDPQNDYIGGNSSALIEADLITACGGISGKAGIGWVLDSASFGSLRDGSPHMVYAHPLLSNGSLGPAFTYYYPDDNGGPLNPPSVIPVPNTGNSPPNPIWANSTPYRISCPLISADVTGRIFTDSSWNHIPGAGIPASIRLVRDGGGYDQTLTGAVNSFPTPPFTPPPPPGTYTMTMTIPAGYFSTLTGAEISDTRRFLLAPGESRVDDFMIAQKPDGSLTCGGTCTFIDSTTCSFTLNYSRTNVPPAIGSRINKNGAFWRSPIPTSGSLTDTLTYGTAYTYSQQIPTSSPGNPYLLYDGSPLPITGGALSSCTVNFSRPTHTLKGYVYQDTSANLCATLTPVRNQIINRLDTTPPILPPVQKTTDLLGYYEYLVPPEALNEGDNYQITVTTQPPLTLDYRVIGSRINSAGAFSDTSTVLLPKPPAPSITTDQTVDFCVSNIKPWWQVESGDVRFGGNLINKVPSTAGVYGSMFNPPALFFSSAGNTSGIPTNKASIPDWRVDNEFSINAPSGIRPALSYGYFVNLIQKKAVGVSELTCPGNDCDINPGTPDGLNRVGGSASGCSSTDFIINGPGVGSGKINLVGGNKRIIVLVNGNAIIPSETEVGPGKLLIVAACGNITFPDTPDTSVGPSSTNALIEGIFTAEGDINIVGAECPAPGNVPDGRLNVAGALIANAGDPFAPGGGGIFNMTRSLCPVNDRLYPAVKVYNRFDFAASMPDEFKSKSSHWKEVQP